MRLLVREEGWARAAVATREIHMHEMGEVAWVASVASVGRSLFLVSMWSF